MNEYEIKVTGTFKVKCLAENVEDAKNIAVRELNNQFFCKFKIEFKLSNIEISDDFI
jgi:hypothetical protein